MHLGNRALETPNVAGQEVITKIKFLQLQRKHNLMTPNNQKRFVISTQVMHQIQQKEYLLLIQSDYTI